MKIPLRIEGLGAAGGTQTIEVSSSQQNIKAKDGKVIEMQKTADHKSETKEMTIPIQIQGRPAIQQAAKTPKVRMLPFEFPSLPSIQMPSMEMPAFNMPMKSASEMMAEMQAQMQAQMSHMQQATMQQMQQMQFSTASSSQQQQVQRQHATATMQSQQQQTVQSVEEVENQDFFVPLRHINRVKKNALSEATAMAMSRSTALNSQSLSRLNM